MKVGAISTDRKGKTKRTRRRRGGARGMEIQREEKALRSFTAPLSGKCHLGVLQMRTVAVGILNAPPTLYPSLLLTYLCSTLCLILYRLRWEYIWDYPSPVYFQKYQYINIHVGNVGTSKEDQEKSHPVVLFTEDTNITLAPGALWYFTALCSRFGSVMLNKSWVNNMYRQVEVVPSTFPLLSVPHCLHIPPSVQT